MPPNDAPPVRSVLVVLDRQAGFLALAAPLAALDALLAWLSVLVRSVLVVAAVLVVLLVAVLVVVAVLAVCIRCVLVLVCVT